MPFHGLWLCGRNSAWPRKPTIGPFTIFYFSCTLSVITVAPPKISNSEVLICLECLSLNSCFSLLRKSSLEQDVFKPFGGYQEYPNLIVIVNVCQLDWCGGGRLWFEAWVNFFAVNILWWISSYQPDFTEWSPAGILTVGSGVPLRSILETLNFITSPNFLLSHSDFI